MIDGVKATMSGDLENMKKTLLSRMIAALLIFLMPTFVNFVVKSVAPNSDYNKCINNATSGKIAASYEETTEYLVSKAERTNTINDYYTALIYLNNVKDSAKRAAFLERLNVVKEKIEASRPKDGGLTRCSR